MFVRFILLLLFFVFFSHTAGAEELWRLRYVIPNSEFGRMTQGADESTETPTTSGHSGHIVFANGFGVGYNRMYTSAILNSSSHRFQSDNLDLSYTLGEKFSLTVGVGNSISGSAEATINGISYITENLKGEATFINLGIPLLGIELLLGYRQNHIEYRNYQGDNSGTTVVIATPFILRSEQLMVGLGFFF